MRQIQRPKARLLIFYLNVKFIAKSKAAVSGSSTLKNRTDSLQSDRESFTSEMRGICCVTGAATPIPQLLRSGRETYYAT